MKEWCDFDIIINLRPRIVFRKLGMGSSKPTSIRFLMADHTVKKHVCGFYVVFVTVESFIFPTNFIILDSHTLTRPFLATRRALMDIKIV